MSKRPRQRDIESVTPPVSPQVVETSLSQVAEHRRCPLCWGARKGYGVAYCTQGDKTHYKCIKTVTSETAPCGHTWTATVVVGGFFVEHRTVSISTR